MILRALRNLTESIEDGKQVAVDLFGWCLGCFKCEFCLLCFDHGFRA